MTDRATAWAVLIVTAALAVAAPASAQTATRDTIGDIIAREAAKKGLALPGKGSVPGGPAGQPQPAAPERDPREGDQAYEQAARLMRAIDAILQDTAKNRGELGKLPSKDEFLIPPVWTETKEDRDGKIRALLDAALGIVTDVPVVDMQRKVEMLRRTIREHEDNIVKLREKQLSAPKDGMLPGLLTDTVDSLARQMEETQKRIALNRAEITTTKAEISVALTKGGIQLTPEQIDMLLDGVLSGDLVRLVAVFSSAKAIDAQLGKLMVQSGDNVGAARKYFAMHAALFAMLVHAQDSLIAKIDTGYLPKLDAIAKDIEAAKRKTADLLRQENRPDQKRALEANRDSQRLAEEASRGYRRYLMGQREQIAAARKRAAHDLRIADNTFETVEASFQLRNLMRDAATSFEAIQRLEAPTFEQIFKNEELRREFENLTRKLDQPGS